MLKQNGMLNNIYIFEKYLPFRRFRSQNDILLSDKTLLRIKT